MDTWHHLTAFITIQIGPQQFKRTGVQGAEGRVETGVMGKPTRAEIKPCFKCTSVPSIIYYSSRSFRRIVLRSRDPNPHGWSLLTCTRWRKGTKKRRTDRETVKQEGWLCIVADWDSTPLIQPYDLVLCRSNIIQLYPCVWHGRASRREERRMRCEV